jgi:hypothetical protein
LASNFKIQQTFGKPMQTLAAVIRLPAYRGSISTGSYSARGEAENRIKEQQLGLFADRTSCMNWLPNQLRVLLSAVAYTLMEAIRRLALEGTQLAKACCQSIRLKL